MKAILVVDDSKTTLTSLKSSLGIAGFKVETAVDGVLAMDKLQAGVKPDRISIDINMPRMDGVALIGAAHKILRFIPILALTAESQQAQRDEAKRLGASGWMVKPIGAADLVKVIRQVLPGA